MRGTLYVGGGGVYHVWIYRHRDEPGRPWEFLGELRQVDGDHLQAYASYEEAEQMCEEYNARHAHLGLRYEVQRAAGRSVL